MLSQLKLPQEIEHMRVGGRILAEGLAKMSQAAAAGISTADLDDIARQHIAAAGGEAAFLNYPGSGGAAAYPGVACISLNDAVVHGIPGRDTILKTGDVVSLDLGVKYQNMIVDGAITVVVGTASPKQAKLINATKKALYAGLKQVKDGAFTGDIGAAIEQVLVSQGLGIVRDLVGHGVGYSVHEDPNIPNFGRRGSGSRLQAGMTIAIEPMATLGQHAVYIDSDGWTVRTRDGSLAAHFEHTVLVTQKGCEILTTL